MSQGWVLSPRAEEELDAILGWLAEESGGVDVPLRVLEDFRSAFDTLAASPNIGRKRRHLTGDAVRWWRVHSYLITYDPAASPLRILRLVHGARDLERLFR